MLSQESQLQAEQMANAMGQRDTREMLNHRKMMREKVRFDEKIHKGIWGPVSFFFFVSIFIRFKSYTHARTHTTCQVEEN